MLHWGALNDEGNRGDFSHDLIMLARVSAVICLGAYYSAMEPE